MILYRLGSLYFVEDSFHGCEAAEVPSDVPTVLRDDVRRRFVIGPTAWREFWENERSKLLIDRGPCKLDEIVLWMPCFYGTKLIHLLFRELRKRIRGSYCSPRNSLHPPICIFCRDLRTLLPEAIEGATIA